MAHRIKEMSSSGRPLVIAGCLPKADRSLVERLSPSASLLGPNSIARAADVVSATLARNKLVVLDDSTISKLNFPRIRLNPVVGIVEIATGCLSQCTFCQTKLAKGALRSYRIGDIVRQVKADVRDGCKEIWLTSTDNGCYGQDIGIDLIDLLKECSDVDGDFMIRIGMMNPMYLPKMIDRLIKILKESPKIFRFLHLPVESGSDRILSKMGRGHIAATFSNAVKKLRDAMNDLTIATDIIVGFPSETEDDFAQTISLIQETKPDVVNISRYSARNGTRAATMSKRNKSEVLKDRSRRLHQIADKVSAERNSVWKHWEGSVLVDELEPVVQGRNYAYKSVMLSSDRSADRILLGEKLRVKINNFSKYSLKGTVC
jgi:MiaB-like tRNA modifying enzyme